MTTNRDEAVRQAFAGGVDEATDDVAAGSERRPPFVAQSHVHHTDGSVSRRSFGEFGSFDDAIRACDDEWDGSAPQEIEDASTRRRWGRNVDSGQFEELPFH